MPVTLTDVAQVAGVSIATASRVLSQSDYPVREETRDRVLQAAEHLGYRPNLTARGLRTDRTYTLGVVLQNVSENVSSSILRGILDYLMHTSFSALILNTDYDPEVEAEVVKDLVQRTADGVIFVDTAKHSVDEVVPYTGIPSIYVNRRYQRAVEEHCVVPNNRLNAYLVTEHLTRLGHRAIAHISGPQGWDATLERVGGYREALRVHGLPVEPDLIERGDWQLPSGYQAAAALLRRDPRPTAVFASSDRMALGAIYAAKDAGLDVPGDVAVVGYDDREFARFVRPSLTTIRMPGYEMGQEAARLLVSRIEGRAESGGVIAVPGELVVRASCGGGAGQHKAGSLVRSTVGGA
jgi:DNA-binding LacI/PurR family transcriptional regulator